ncbi:MAG: amidohydrolase family protein [Euryarchaeota archaeon]|nr:amidohydrolase family protein [Euryarchaeota archaeon]
MADHSSTALRGALLVTQDDERKVFRGDVLLRDGTIEQVAPAIKGKADHELDAHRYLIAPGFVNTHTHIANALLKGTADDRGFFQFLETMFAVDAKRTEEDIEAGALLGAAEMLLGGTTGFLDMYYGEDAVARACERIGIRGFLGWVVLDPEITTQKGVPVENAAHFITRWKKHERVSPLVSLQGVYACKDDTWLKAKELAEREKVLLHYHLSETRGEVQENEKKRGKRPPEWLDSLGFLGRHQVAAHGVWLTTREIELLARKGVAVAHCPSSNMKLASGGGGICPVTELRAAGATVAMATDSSSSNNGLSMLREMHLAALAHKQQRHDPESLPAPVVLDMATRDAAKALGRERDLGQLAPGYKADLVLYDLSHPSLLPTRVENAVSNLVYSAQDDAVHTVYVQGEKVVEARRLLKLDWEKEAPNIERIASALLHPASLG